MLLPPDLKLSHLHFLWDNMICFSYKKQINHLQSYSPKEVQLKITFTIKLPILKLGG